jgi:predicted NUDIX family NTP pyrophosphohydrolase
MEVSHRIPQGEEDKVLDASVEAILRISRETGLCVREAPFRAFGRMPEDESIMAHRQEFVRFFASLEANLLLGNFGDRFSAAVDK